MHPLGRPRKACDDRRVDVSPIPGLEHLPYAEVWFHEVDEERFGEASAKARALDKDGLEVWTTDRTPEVATFLAARGYEQVRRYVISELDLAAAADLGPPGRPLTSLAERPDLERALYELALECYPDQPGREGSSIGSFEHWRSWGLDPHPPDACFVALEGARPVGYGYLEVEDGQARHGFAGITRAARGRGLIRAIRLAQVAWAREHGFPTLRTANEARLTQMLALNEQQGYVRLYDELVLRGPLARRIAP